MDRLLKKNPDFFESYFSAIDTAIDAVHVESLIETAEMIWQAHKNGG
jgi:hypothetical protein